MLNDTMQSKNNKIKLLICIIGLLILFTIETIGKRILNEYIHTAWILCFAVALPYEGVLYLISFLIPLCALLPHFAHVFLALFAVLLFKKHFVLNCKTVSLSLAFIFFLTFWEFLAFINYGASTLNRMLGYVSIICVFLWILYEKKHGNYRQHLNLYILSVCSLSVLAFVNTIQSFSGNWFVAFLRGGIRLGGTANSNFSETDIALNANTLAYFSVVAIACYISMYGSKNKKNLFWNMFELIEVVIILIVGMLTVSRSWLLVLLAIVFIFILSKFKSEKNLNKIIPILLVIFMSAVFFLNSGFMQAFSQRFQSESVNTAGGRTDLLKEYFSLYFSNPKYVFFGTGVTDYAIVLGTKVSMHNATQQILICLGFPAAIAFFAAILIPILRAKKKSNTHLQQWLPFIAVVTFVQTIQFLNPNAFMLPYITGLYAILQSRKKET